MPYSPKAIKAVAGENTTPEDERLGNRNYEMRFWEERK
jgi:hypothetical protein